MAKSLQTDLQIKENGCFLNKTYTSAKPTTWHSKMSFCWQK